MCCLSVYLLQKFFFTVPELESLTKTKAKALLLKLNCLAFPKTKAEWGFPEDYKGKKPSMKKNWPPILNAIGNLICFALVTKGGVPKATCELNKLCNDEEVEITMDDFKTTWDKDVKPYIPEASPFMRLNIGQVAKNFVQKRKFGVFDDGASYVACNTEKNAGGGGAPLYKPIDDALIKVGWDAQQFIEVEMFYTY